MMATLHVSARDMTIKSLESDLGVGQIVFSGTKTKLLALCDSLSLRALMMTGQLPLRIVAGIIWGQDKADAELDCLRRLREMGR